MNPYKIDLDKLVKNHSSIYCYLRLLSWVVLMYASVWAVIGFGLFLALR